MRPGIVAGGVIVALIIIAVVQFWPQQQASDVPIPPDESQPTASVQTPVDPDPVVEPAVTETVAPVGQGPEAELETPAMVLPSLDASDDYVREEVASWGLPAALMQRSDLLARLAVVLVNTADGAVPAREVAVLAPEDRFSVLRREVDGEEVLYADPANYARFDRYLTMLEAIPPQSLAGFLRRVEPLLLQALAQLGERRSPAQLLQSAAEHLRHLPMLPAQVELIRPNVLYRYADPELEALPALDKQLLRFGPDNLARLQRYLQGFNQAYRSN